MTYPDQDTAAARNRERLLAAAIEVFMEDGYRASLDKVIARAGIVRQTLYNHFTCKDDLFTEAIRRLSSNIVVTLTGEPTELQKDLTNFGVMIRSLALSAEGVAMFRVLIAEAPRFAKLAKAVYAEGAGNSHKQLTAYLRKAMQAGRLRRDDPKLATSMLLGMLINQDRDRCLFGVEEHQTCEVAEVERIVACFLRAFAP